jgi:pantothenate kinase
MTVNDIYGGSIGDILHKDIIAASFGKVSRMNDLT